MLFRPGASSSFLLLTEHFSVLEILPNRFADAFAKTLNRALLSRFPNRCESLMTVPSVLPSGGVEEKFAAASGHAAKARLQTSERAARNDVETAAENAAAGREITDASSDARLIDAAGDRTSDGT